MANNNQMEKVQGSSDRFEKISRNYGELFSEVFEVQGMDYRRLQESIFEQVSQIEGYKEMPILDVGVGDGQTSQKFIEVGCQDYV